MKTKFLPPAALFALLAAPLARASALSDDLVANLYAMKSVYQTSYAPADWKKQFTGYDLQANFAQALAITNQQSSTITEADVRAILIGFVDAMRDYHTSISFVSTEKASLPLLAQEAGGRLFLASIDRSKLGETTFPFHVGDEIIAINGRPALEELNAVQATFPENVASTDRARAALSLFARSAARGYKVPQGPITLGLLRQGETKVRSEQLAWDYTPEKIQDRTRLSDWPAARTPGTFSHPMMNVDFGTNLAMETAYDLGARQTFTPDLGEKKWQSDEKAAFYAYTFETPDHHRVGYIRLPSYVPSDSAQAVKDFQTLVARFQKETEALVIDQVNNPGGSVFYLYALASMLSEEPLVAPRHRMTLTQDTISNALSNIPKMEAVQTDADAQKALAGSDLDGYPASYEFAQFSLAQDRFLIQEWNQGHRLTAPYWIAGVDHINPAAHPYTKPILLLINHLDFSGGDFFPTILQDNHRATVFGTRTAGAGGYVLDVKIPNAIGIDAFRYTGSIAERVSGNPIENLGVTPDVPYEITPEDLQTSYAPYVKAIQAELGALLK